MQFQSRYYAATNLGLTRGRVRYWRHLAEDRFTLADPAYVTFGVDQFHDGEVCVQAVDLVKGSVTITFRNVCAMDQAPGLFRERGGDRRKLKYACSDFTTRVEFCGVSEFSVRGFGSTSIGPPQYLESELRKTPKGTRLDILCYCPRSTDNDGHVVVCFKSVEVEDVIPKIAKYFPSKARAREAVMGITHNPAWYLRREERNLAWLEKQRVAGKGR